MYDKKTLTAIPISNPTVAYYSPNNSKRIEQTLHFHNYKQPNI